MAGSLDVNFCTVRVDSNKCDYCLECVNTCPNEALTYDSQVKVFMHNAYECNYEKECEQSCKNNAITIIDM